MSSRPIICRKRGSKVTSSCFKKNTKPREHTVSGVLYVLSELDKFATAAWDKSFSGRQAVGKSEHFLTVVGNPFIKDNLKNITDESVHLGHNAVSLGRQTLMFPLKRQDLITDRCSVISQNRSPNYTAVKTSKLTQNVTVSESYYHNACVILIYCYHHLTYISHHFRNGKWWQEETYEHHCLECDLSQIETKSSNLAVAFVASLPSRNIWPGTQQKISRFPHLYRI